MDLCSIRVRFWRSLFAGLCTLRWLVSTYNIQEVQAVEDRDTLVCPAKDVEMGIVGDDMGGATDNCAGEDEIIVWIGGDDGSHVLRRDDDMLAQSQQVGDILIGNVRGNLAIYELFL